MNSFMQTGVTRHEYRLKGWQRIFYLLLGGVAIVGGGFLALMVLSEQDGAVIAAITMFFPLLGLYVLAWALRARLVLDGTRIEVRGVFRDQYADLSEIEGFRMIRTSNDADYTRLYLKEGRGKITISQAFDTDDNYLAWFQLVTDLDARDRNVLLDEISQDAELGFTPEERLSALKQAKTRSYVANAIACVAAVGLYFGAANLRVPAAVVLALTPLVMLFMVQRLPLLYAISMKKADPRADLSLALIVASFGLALQIVKYDFVSMQPLLMLIIPAALVFIAAYYSAVSKNTNRAATLFILLFYGCFYSFGLAVVTDTLADNSKASTYIVPVSGKHTSSGRSTTYYLELVPWGPLQSPNELSVSSSFYDSITVGDQVCLGLHPGRLHAAWYRLSDCPAQPDAQPAQ
jgi:hypothetical protein